jgi:hypothetical protein
VESGFSPSANSAKTRKESEYHANQAGKNAPLDKHESLYSVIKLVTEISSKEFVMFRVLVTGSRDWEDVAAVRAEFDVIAQHEGKEVVLVSGNCPNGADKIAEDLASEYGWALELHPADWQTHGKSAGFKRNTAMVETGVQYCLAFIKNESAGASHTAKKAREAKVPTKVVAVSTKPAAWLVDYLK